VSKTRTTKDETPTDEAERNYQVRLPVAVVDRIMEQAKQDGHKAFGTWLRLHLVDHAKKLGPIQP
jgi:hypothetical protein